MSARLWYLLEKSKVLCTRSGEARRAFDENSEKARSLLETAEIINARNSALRKQLITPSVLKQR